MNAFSFLKDGKFNNSEIMKHAHILKAYRRISLSEALKQAWFLAKKQQKEYREIEEEAGIQCKQGKCIESVLCR